MQDRETHIKAAEAEGHPPLRVGVWVLTLLCIASTVSFIDRSLLNLLVQPIKAAFVISDTEISLIQGFAFAVFYAIAGLPIAMLTDRWKRAPIIAVGVAVWSVASAACGLAAGAASLFVARVFVGIGEATLAPPSFSMLPDLFSKARLGRALAVFTMGGALGTGLGLLFGGLALGALAANNGIALPLLGHLEPWRAAFVLMGAPGVLLGLLMALTIREPARREMAQRVSAASKATFADLGRVLKGDALTYALMFCAYPFGSLAFNGWMAWSPAFLIRKFGLSPAESAGALGWVFLIFGTAGVLSSGVLNDWLFRRGIKDAAVRLSVLSAVLMAISGVAAPFMPNLLAFSVLFSIFVFFGSYLAIVPMIGVQLITPNRQRAQVTSLLLFVVSVVGGGLGPTSVALLTDLLFHDEAQVGASLAVVAGVCFPLLAILLLLGVKPYRKSVEAHEGVVE
jgi:MFS family permease